MNDCLKSLSRDLLTDLVIDLGTENTLLMTSYGVQLRNEPSVVALSQDREGQWLPLAAGHAAAKMEGRTPPSIKVVRPLNNGVIVHPKAALQMLKLLLAQHRPLLGFGSILISIPFATTAIEAKAFADLAWGLGPRRVLVVAEPLAAALGADIEILKNQGQMLVDIGKGIIEAVVTTQGCIVTSASSRLEGRSENERLIQYFHNEHRLMLGPQSVERTKRLLLSGNAPEMLPVSGGSLLTRMPRLMSVRSAELFEVLEPCVNEVISCIERVLDRVPVELFTDVMEQGIALTGGGALHHSLATRLSDKLGVPVVAVREPLHAVARGNCQILRSRELTQILAS